jgi:polyhydroxyalkanoate synthase
LANQVSGSWWPDWMQWLRRFAGKQVPAPEQPGSEKHKAIEPAPGRYVQARSH